MFLFVKSAYLAVAGSLHVRIRLIAHYRLANFIAHDVCPMPIAQCPMPRPIAQCPFDLRGYFSFGERLQLIKYHDSINIWRFNEIVNYTYYSSEFEMAPTKISSNADHYRLHPSSVKFAVSSSEMHWVTYEYETKPLRVNHDAWEFFNESNRNNIFNTKNNISNQLNG